MNKVFYYFTVILTNIAFIILNMNLQNLHLLSNCIRNLHRFTIHSRL